MSICIMNRFLIFILFILILKIIMNILSISLSTILNEVFQFLIVPSNILNQCAQSLPQLELIVIFSCLPLCSSLVTVHPNL